MSNLKQLILSITLLITFQQIVSGQDADPQTEKSVLDGIKIGGQWFVGYFNEKNDGNRKNDFAIKRGYITISKKFNEKFTARLTQDISVDQEGDGIGDIELRIKYAYAKYRFNNWWVFTDPSIEFGVVHRPWLSFEQKINSYRVQGRMFFERVGLVSSADYGLYFESLFGGKLSREYRENINGNYPGKYGSIGIGIFNGGGYNKLEYNKYKNIELRSTLRPLPELLPGFQMSYIGGFGKGNTPNSPDYVLNSVFLSYENTRLITTMTYYTGKGLQDGSSVDSHGNALEQNGYSGFLEIKFPVVDMSFFSRYDFFEQDLSSHSIIYKNYIIGLAYDLIESSRIIVSYDHTRITDKRYSSSTIYEATLELSF